MQEVITQLETAAKKAAVADVRSGDSVRVHQKIWEGKKERVQVFEGTVIRTRRLGSLTANITVRRIASGVGVEKTYFLHSPNVQKVDITKRGRVRRNYLTYLRKRQGKATRLTSLEFDRTTANVKEQPVTTKDETARPGAKAKKPVATKNPAETKTPTATKAEVKADMPEKPLSKAEAKKAKAEAFRKAQAAKK